MSEPRLTFRKTDELLAYQKQLRDQYSSEGCPLTDDRLVLSLSKIKRVNRKIAQSIILKYEWLGTLPNATHYYGLFFDDFCAGVTCISCGGGGANLNAHIEFGLKSQNEIAYLSRGANVHWSPTGANSRLVSWTCKMMKRDSKAKLIIAYSDTDAGEIGTIYQACNWICIGRGSSTTQYINSAGKVYDQKLPYYLSKKHGGTRAYWHGRLIKEGWTTQKSNPKFRYVFILDEKDKRLRNLVMSKKTAYPKRPNAAVAHVGELPQFHEEGTFDSIPPLQSTENQDGKD